MKNVKTGKNCRIHKTAIVGAVPGRKCTKSLLLTIGDNADIRSNSVVYLGTKIGRDLKTGHNAVIREENVIGNGFCLWSNSILDYNCRVGNNVKIHSNCYIAQNTEIGDNVFIAPGVTVANDMHPGCRFSQKCMRGPLIKSNVKIGVNATILPFVVIGKNSLVGAGSVVTRDIPDNSVVFGNPAKVVKSVYDLECRRGLTDKPYKARIDRNISK